MSLSKGWIARYESGVLCPVPSRGRPRPSARGAGLVSSRSLAISRSSPPISQCGALPESCVERRPCAIGRQRRPPPRQGPRRCRRGGASSTLSRARPASPARRRSGRAKCGRGHRRARARAAPLVRTAPCPVAVSCWLTSSGRSLATTRPPRGPLPGPNSTSWSQAADDGGVVLDQDDRVPARGRPCDRARGAGARRPAGVVRRRARRARRAGRPRRAGPAWGDPQSLDLAAAQRVDAAPESDVADARGRSWRREDRRLCARPNDGARARARRPARPELPDTHPVDAHREGRPIRSAIRRRPDRWSTARARRDFAEPKQRWQRPRPGVECRSLVGDSPPCGAARPASRRRLPVATRTSAMSRNVATMLRRFGDGAFWSRAIRPLSGVVPVDARPRPRRCSEVVDLDAPLGQRRRDRRDEHAPHEARLSRARHAGDAGPRPSGNLQSTRS